VAWRAITAAATLAALSCGGGAPAPPDRPSILLITLDTTRADAVRPDVAPAFNAVAARGRRFSQAYATVPETLPSHTAMLSGLYPAAHGVHENARVVPASTPLVTDALAGAGYRTAAFVSSFVLAGRFGLSRSFTVYDDALPPGAAERAAAETAGRALAWLASAKDASGPVFLWVHFNDPHAPYAPPEPYRARFATDLYRGEVAAMDAEMARLVSAFDAFAGARGAVIIAADHGEGLGEHGEREHGHLLYQSTMHVPMAVAGPGVTPGTIDAPVSTRAIAGTLLDFAGLDTPVSLRRDPPAGEVVLGEAMKPFLEYGWQPQVMAVDGRYKAILSGRVEGYDLAADAAEATDIAGGPALPGAVRNALFDYPVPTPGAGAVAATMSPADRQKLASLGYVSGGPAPVVRADAPRTIDMLPTLDRLVAASALFSAGRYTQVVPLLRQIVARDPQNLAAWLQLATSLSLTGRVADADAAFDRAASVAPQSVDVRYYRALHDGQRAMGAGDTAAAIAAFERARGLRADSFGHDLELGALYLAARRFTDARDAFDRVLAITPTHPMALFKRAQVSVLLREPDAARRIALATAHADAVTRPLIREERLFK
jgi:tetratricopeptide (TPR) repeat protein